MNATDLKGFDAVARHCSMNQAAAELNTIQSDVTARVRALELELGVLLFKQHARGVSSRAVRRRRARQQNKHHRMFELVSGPKSIGAEASDASTHAREPWST
jgi:DNA-binding transcriptional LysR family regulator